MLVSSSGSVLLTEELFKIFQTLDANPSALLKNFENLILTQLQNISSEDPQYKELHDYAAILSLSNLCYLNPIEGPIQFLHTFLRWIQFFYADESRWVEYFQNNHSISKEEHDIFLRVLLRLVCSRHFEQACLLLRNAIVFWNNPDYNLPMKEILNWLLEAPSPSQTCSDPGLFSQWIQENRHCFETFSSTWPNGLLPIINVLMGFGVGDELDLTWIEKVGSDTLYRAYDDHFSTLDLLRELALKHSKGKTGLMDLILVSLLTLDIDYFFELIREIPAWAKLCSKPTKDSFVIEYLDSLQIADWKIAIEYARSLDNDGTDILQDFFTVAPAETISEIYYHYRDDPFVYLAIKRLIQVRMMNDLNSEKLHAALRWAMMIEEKFFIYITLERILTQFASSNDSQLLRLPLDCKNQNLDVLFSFLLDMGSVWKFPTPQRLCLMETFVEYASAIPKNILQKFADLIPLLCKGLILPYPLRARLLELVDSHSLANERQVRLVLALNGHQYQNR